VINDRLLRKFFFAIMEEHYGDQLTHNFGYANTMPDCMNIGDQFDEVAFFEDVTETVGA